jgi:hypothetical protein
MFNTPIIVFERVRGMDPPAMQTSTPPAQPTLVTNWGEDIQQGNCLDTTVEQGIDEDSDSLNYSVVPYVGDVENCNNEELEMIDSIEREFRADYDVVKAALLNSYGEDGVREFDQLPLSEQLNYYIKCKEHEANKIYPPSSLQAAAARESNKDAIMGDETAHMKRAYEEVDDLNDDLLN